MKAARFKDNVAIVTGASSGIGRATAVALAGKGAAVVAASRNEAALKALSKEIGSAGGKVVVVPTDVTDKVQVDSLIRQTLERFGRVDIVVCSAGVYMRRPVRDLSLDDIGHAMAVNFYGAVHCIHAVLPHMLERKSGHIVVVSSVDGKKGLPPDGAYVASKFAITGLLDVLRQELRGTGVYASTILPGRVDTPMIASLKVPSVSSKIPGERVARAVLRAIAHRKAEIIVPYLGPKTLVVLSSVSPRLGDWLVRLFGLEGTKETL
jgi:NADP-dependent 3-hydroxy acid dehydrogenase YdfG